jgi:hypothetical protein
LEKPCINVIKNNNNNNNSMPNMGKRAIHRAIWQTVLDGTKYMQGTRGKNQERNIGMSMQQNR